MTLSTRIYSALFALSLSSVAYFTVTAAYAADHRGKRNEVSASEPIYDSAPPIWQGLYWGASIGYGWGTSEQYYDRAGNHGMASTDPSGPLGALTLGYNYMWSPRMLVGIEADIGLMDVSANDEVVYDGHVYKTSFGPWWGTLRGRVGWQFNRAMLYATGGWAFMDVDEVSIGNTPGETAYNRDWRSGWVLGAGVEYALMPGVTGKVEYLHMDFGTYEGYSANREDYSFDNRVDLIRTGLNFKF
jgi:outer membrane immunogenic protein